MTGEHGTQPLFLSLFSCYKNGGAQENEEGKEEETEVDEGRRTMRRTGREVETRRRID